MYFTTLFLMFDLLIHVHTYGQSVGLVSMSVEGSHSIVFLHVSDYRKGHLVREDSPNILKIIDVYTRFP